MIVPPGGKGACGLGFSDRGHTGGQRAATTSLGSAETGDRAVWESTADRAAGDQLALLPAQKESCSRPANAVTPAVRHRGL
jgi:hypothetical protein